MPVRIQRKRTKGFNLQAASPNGLPVVYVGRPSRWGNDLRVGQVLNEYAELVVVTPQMAVDYFKADIAERIELGNADMRPLRGKNLACFCPLCNRHRDGKPLSEHCPDCAPCHVDVLGELLLEIANA